MYYFSIIHFLDGTLSLDHFWVANHQLRNTEIEIQKKGKETSLFNMRAAGRAVYLALEQGLASLGLTGGAIPPLQLGSLTCEPVTNTPQSHFSVGAHVMHISHQADLSGNRGKYYTKNMGLVGL